MVLHKPQRSFSASRRIATSLVPHHVQSTSFGHPSRLGIEYLEHSLFSSLNSVEIGVTIDRNLFGLQHRAREVVGLYFSVNPSLKMNADHMGSKSSILNTRYLFYGCRNNNFF